MIGNFSFHLNYGNVEQFCVFSQVGETSYFQLIGTSLSNHRWVALLFLTLLVLSMPGNIAIIATVFKNGLNGRPVNLLILVDQCVNSVQRYQTSFVSQYILINGDGLGEPFCEYWRTFIIFGALNTTLGSLPIAVFRLIAISRPLSPWMEHVVAKCLLAACLMANAFMTWAITVTIPLSYVKAVCMGRNTQFVEVIRDYTSRTTSWPGLAQMIFGATAVLQLVEGFVYFSIFRHIYRAERSVRPFLTERSIKSRRKRNALTMMSQFYNYVMEQAFISSLLLISVNKVELGIWLPILGQIEFATRNTVQALASSETRQELISLLRNIRQMCWFSRSNLVAPLT